MLKSGVKMLNNKILKSLKLYEDFNAKIATYDRTDNSDIFLLFIFFVMRYKQLVHSYYEQNHTENEEFIFKKVEAEMWKSNSDPEFNQLKVFKTHSSASTFINVVNKLFRYYSGTLKSTDLHIMKLIKVGYLINDKEGYTALYDLKDKLFPLLINSEKDSFEPLLFNDVILEIASRVNREQFSTHKELNNIVANLLKGLKVNSIYDPACGSASLLVESAFNAQEKIVIYGQDNEEKLILFAELNSILAGLEANFRVQDSFKNDNKHYPKVDMVISEPPLFAKDLIKLDEAVIREEEQEYSQEQSKLLSSDEVFILNMSRRLKQSGLMILILPHSILYKEAEEKIYRQEIVAHYNSLDAVIVPSVKDGKRILSNYVILVYRPGRNKYDTKTKKISKLETDIMIINDDSGSELTPESIASIYLNRQEIPGISRIVPQAEIVNNDFNLNISLYLQQEKNAELSYEEMLSEIEDVEQELKKVQSQLENALRGKI